MPKSKFAKKCQKMPRGTGNGKNFARFRRTIPTHDACFGLAGLPVVPSLGLVWPGPVLPALPDLPWPGPATTTTASAAQPPSPPQASQPRQSRDAWILGSSMGAYEIYSAWIQPVWHLYRVTVILTLSVYIIPPGGNPDIRV